VADDQFLGKGWGLSGDLRQPGPGGYRGRGGRGHPSKPRDPALHSRRRARPQSDVRLEAGRADVRAAVDLIAAYVTREIETAILFFESRIELNSVNFESEPDQEGLVLIRIDYTVRTTNTRTKSRVPVLRHSGDERMSTDLFRRYGNLAAVRTGPTSCSVCCRRSRPTTSCRRALVSPTWSSTQGAWRQKFVTTI